MNGSSLKQKDFRHQFQQRVHCWLFEAYTAAHQKRPGAATSGAQKSRASVRSARALRARSDLSSLARARPPTVATCHALRVRRRAQLPRGSSACRR